MKAFLLAAGLGSRLRPLTNDIPKCLIPVNGRPLLGFWIDLFEEHGISEVLINLHHFSNKVVEYIQSVTTSVQFVFFDEAELLGSAGTIRDNYDFVKDEESFLICYADNLTNIDLSHLIAFHKEKRQLLSMALFRAAQPKSCGIAVLNNKEIIVDFVEKPETPFSDLANGGVYAASPEIIKLIPNKPVADIGFDLLPLLKNKMAGFEIKNFHLDIGTFENLKKAEAEWPVASIKNQN